jgi:hypothetical protein
MQSVILNIDDSIFQEVIKTLESYPGDKVEIIDNNPTQNDLEGFAEDLRNAFLEINEMETGRKKIVTWQDVRDEL